MKAILLFVGLLMALFVTAQNGSDTMNGLILTDTQKVYINEYGVQTYTVCMKIDGRDSIISFTVNPSAMGEETDGEPFYEEYFMVLVFLGLLVLFGLYQFLKKKDKKEEAAAEEIYVSKHFGEINKTAPEEFYETKADLYERQVDLIIHLVTEKRISQENIERIEDYIDHLVINENKINKAIHEDFRQNGEVKNFIDLYLEDDAGNKTFADMTGANGQVFTKEEQVLSLLHLLRINFYPEENDRVFAALDYAIDDGVAGRLLMVVISKDNRINITTES